MALLAACAAGPIKSPAEHADPLAGRPPPEVAPRAAHPAPPPPPEAVGQGPLAPPAAASLADAEPMLEPIDLGGPNKPYEKQGRRFVPITDDRPLTQRGLASWYGRQFHGRRTASGERYDMHAMTAAHPTLPLPSFVRVRNPANGREVIVRINDRGPFHAGRIIDLSYNAAQKLDVVRNISVVEIERITQDEIRTGSWRHDGPSDDPSDVAVDRQLAQRAAQPPAASAVKALPAATTVAALLPMAPMARVSRLPEPSKVEPMVTASADPVAVVASIAAVAGPGPGPSALPGFWVQIGAFRLRDGAERFQRRVMADLAWIAPVLSVLSESDLHRLQAGPFPSRGEANGVAQRLRDALSLMPVVVERH